MRKLSLTMITIVSLSMSAFAGSGRGHAREIKKKQHQAENEFENHHYQEALNIYMEIEPESKDKGMVDYMIGMCLMSTPEKEKALTYLKAAEETNRPSFVIHYYLGRAYYENQDYAKAYRYLSLYHEELTHAYGIVFKPFKTEDIPGEQMVHYQKSANDVSKIIQECKSHLTTIH